MKATCLIVIIVSCVGLETAVSESSWPPNSDDSERCELVDLCGSEYCARLNCSDVGCPIIPFIPISGCVCPKGSYRLLVGDNKPGKCAPAKSYECERQAKLTSKKECYDFLDHKPCRCDKNEECTVITNSCDDSCLTINCTECRSNPNQRIPYCKCKTNFRRLANGKCVDANSCECQAEAIKSLDKCKYVELYKPKPCRCDYCYEPPK